MRIKHIQASVFVGEGEDGQAIPPSTCLVNATIWDDTGNRHDITRILHQGDLESRFDVVWTYMGEDLQAAIKRHLEQEAASAQKNP